MPRKKETVDVYEKGQLTDQPDQVEATETGKAGPPEGFKKLFGAIKHKKASLGRGGVYQPVYVPEGVRVFFYLAPGASPEAAAEIKLAEVNGIFPLPPELVTADIDDAIANGKVCLLHYEVIDNQVRVGHHVAMVRLHEEWFKTYMKQLREIESVLNYRRHGVEVSELRSEEQVQTFGEES